MTELFARAAGAGSAGPRRAVNTDCEKVLVVGKDALLAGAGEARDIPEPDRAKRAAD